MHCCRALFLLLLAPPLVAQSHFDGVWKMKMDTLEFSGPPEKYLIADGMYDCLSCIPPVHVRTDGSDQKVGGHESFYDTIAVQIVDTNSVSFVFKRKGRPAAKSLETVAPDGQTMIEEFSNGAKSEEVAGKASFTRVSSGPEGAHVLSGGWRMDTVQNSTPSGTLTTFQSIPGGLRISDGVQSCVAKFDGNDYPIGLSGHATIALKLVDEYSLEETDKHDGNIMSVARMIVSKDGKSMKVETTDKQRGGVMTYTAEKLQ